jgi:diguanylate cyclase (GGDEF)-like protein/putative nucleotidyltransferase with HDIG domain
VVLGITRPDHGFAGRSLRLRLSRETTWLLPVVGPVSTAGAATSTAAVIALARSDVDVRILVGVLALLVAATFAEAFPVPIEGVPVGGTSLANIFIVGAGVIYGWAAGVVVAAATMALIEGGHRRPASIRVVYNTAVYALAAGVAGAAAAPFRGDELAPLLLGAMCGSAGFYAVNIALLALVIGRSSRERFPPLLLRYVRWTVVPFSIMASVTLMLVVVWDRSPLLAVPLIGPLLAIALYQRSVHRALEAMRLARTDPLTGLGNARSFNERLDAEFNVAQTSGSPLTLCLLDLDDFKAINDTYGHGTGDSVLAEIARRLRHPGEAFRLGGDEFALLFPGSDGAEAAKVAQRVVDRVTGRSYAPGVRLTLSVGVASFPHHASDERELMRRADRALYQAKDEGKNRVRMHQPEDVEITQLRRLADETDRAARLRAAASLAKAVDERDAYAGRHCLAVGELSGMLAVRLGLEGNDVELVRLAGRLHDLGKLAVPEEILKKPGPLTDEERAVLERHAQIGFAMLESLGIDPVANWVLHHHERWDGDGYPGRLAGSEIPLGARIIFVADAFDAMTSDRVYRRGISAEEALAELRRCSGAQFDPSIVNAFETLRKEGANKSAARVAVRGTPPRPRRLRQT